MEWVAEQAVFQLIPGPFFKDAAGKPYAGVAALSAWPCEPFTLPCLSEDLTEPICFDDRHPAIKMHRPRQRLLLVVNVYLQSGDPYLAALQGKRIIDRTASTGEDLLSIGDFNATPDESPALPYTSSGMLFLADDAAGTRPTRTRKDGRYRWIVYALHSLHVVPQTRGQVEGIVDHDLVYLEFEFNKPCFACFACQPLNDHEPCFTCRPNVQLKIDSDLNSDGWDPVWTAHQANFRTAVADRHSDAAWTLLSNAAETLTLEPDADLNRPKR